MKAMKAMKKMLVKFIKLNRSQELVPTQQHATELQPLVAEKHRQLPHRGHVQRAARQPVHKNFHRTFIGAIFTPCRQ